MDPKRGSRVAIVLEVDGRGTNLAACVAASLRKTAAL